MTYGFFNPLYSDLVILNDDNQLRHFFRILGYKECAYGMALDQMYFSTWFSIPKKFQSSIIPVSRVLQNKNLTVEEAMKSYNEVAESSKV